MAKLNEQDFRKEITSDDLKSLYLIYGEEKYLVRKYTDRLIKKVVGKKSTDFDTTVFNGNVSLDDLYSAVQSIPVFSDRKCIVVKDYDISSLSEGDMKSLESLFSEISEQSVLVFTMPTLKFDEKKKTDGKGGAKIGKFASLAAKYGTVLELAPLGDIAVEKQIIAWAQEQGCKITSINASKIVYAVGTDLNALKNETDKLCAYANGAEITDKMIGLLCPKNTETRIYALADSISKNDFNGTYRQLEMLFDKNERPEIILSVLSSAFVDMYRMRAATESGKTNAEVASDFKYGKREFVLKNARSNVAKYTTETLREILEIILEADISLKSTSVDHKVVLETMVAKMLVTVKEGKAV